MKEKIRAPIVWFNLYVILMLYQVGNSGRLAAFGTIAMTIITCILLKEVSIRKFVMPSYSRILWIFFVIVSLVTFIKWGIDANYYKLSGQILLCIVLAAIQINKREYEFIRTMFVSSTVVYALLALYYCIGAGTARYYHSSIIIFGALFDPNFIGIPFVFALVLLLENVLMGKKRWLSIPAYLIIAAAVVFTSSRGNMISWVATSVGVFLWYIFHSDNKLMKKLFWSIVIFIVAAFFIHFVSVRLSTQWERMTVISEGSDNGRLHLWQRAIEAWKEAPLFGQGFRGIYHIFGKATHNTYLQILSETGLIGAGLFLSFIALLLKQAHKVNKCLFIAFCGTLLQITFLDALDNRVLWIIFCWIAMLRNRQE